MHGDFFNYTIDNQDEKNIHATIVINKEHNIFKGHFPDFPLVPGVCQVQMIKEIISGYFNKPIVLKKAKSIKFLSMISPNENTKIKASISYRKEEGKIIKIDAGLYSGNQNYFKLKGEFSEGE